MSDSLIRDNGGQIGASNNQTRTIYMPILTDQKENLNPFISRLLQHRPQPGERQAGRHHRGDQGPAAHHPPRQERQPARGTYT